MTSEMSWSSRPDTSATSHPSQETLHSFWQLGCVTSSRQKIDENEIIRNFARQGALTSGLGDKINTTLKQKHFEKLVKL